VATSSYAKAILGGLPTEMKSAMFKFAEYVFDRNLEFGPVDPDAETSAATNLRGRWVMFTTASVADAEFSVAHGLSRPPNVFWPIGNPRSINSRVVGDLVVTRAADSKRLYLSSAYTDTVGYLYVE
jgi:hypothetical protein